MDQHKMIGGRKLTVKLIAVLSILVSFVVGNWYFSRCTVLCESGFWNARPSAEEVAAELHFFTDLSRVRATGLKLFVPFEASFTPLHFAASSGYIEGVGALVAAGANPRATDIEGRAPRDLVTHRHILTDEVTIDMLDQ